MAIDRPEPGELVKTVVELVDFVNGGGGGGLPTGGNTGQVLTKASNADFDVDWENGGGGGGGQLFYTVGTPGVAGFGNFFKSPPDMFAVADFQSNGVDDSIAIQAAINAAAALAPTTGLQPTVYILPGIYIMGQTIDTNGIRLIGYGSSFTQLYWYTPLGTPANTIAIDNTGSGGDVLLEELQILSSVGSGQPTITGPGSTGEYRRVSITANDSSGGSFRVLWNGQIIDSTISGNGGDLLGGNASGGGGGIIENSTIGGDIHISFPSTITNSTLHSVTLVDTTNSDIRFVNNVVRDLDLGNNTLTGGTSIIGNKINTFFIRGANLGESSNILVAYNDVGAGFHIDHNDPSESLHSSIFSHNKVGDAFGGGMTLFDVVIDNNIMSGLVLAAGSSASQRVTVSNNVVNGIDSAVLAGFDIENASYFTVTGNNISCQNYGIFLDTVTFSVVSGNLVHEFNLDSNVYDGLRIGTCDRLNAQGNTFSAFTGYGINVISGNDNLVTNNDLKNSGLVGSFNDTATGTVTTAGNRL